VDGSSTGVRNAIEVGAVRAGVALQPGEKKVIEMVVDEIETFRYLARTDRGFYPDGPKKGRPFPAHPVKILDAGPIRHDEMALASSEPERPKIEA
jgi:hypothetical protein